MSKKYFCALLTLALTGAALTGCGRKETAKPAAVPAAQAEEQGN